MTACQACITTKANGCSAISNISSCTQTKKLNRCIKINESAAFIGFTKIATRTKAIADINHKLTPKHIVYVQR
jgi:hypothetical protein